MMETQQSTTRAMSLDRAQAAYKALLARQKADREAATARVRAAKARETEKLEARNTRRKVIFYDALFGLYLDGKIDVSLMQMVRDSMPAKDRAYYDEWVPGGDWTPNAETVAAMNEPPGEPITLEQFKAEMRAMADEE